MTPIIIFCEEKTQFESMLDQTCVAKTGILYHFLFIRNESSNACKIIKSEQQHVAATWL